VKYKKDKQKMHRKHKIQKVKEGENKKVDLKNNEIAFFKIFIFKKDFPLQIRFHEFKGEAMLFYSKNEENKHPNMHRYDKLLIIDPKQTELVNINFHRADNEQKYFYFSFSAEDYTTFEFSTQFTQSSFSFIFN